MGRSKIEWVRNSDGRPGYSINPVKGLCPMACKDNQGKEYCYARRMYKRFGWNPAIRYDPSVFLDLPDKPSKIFVGSTFELFHPFVSDTWLTEILSLCKRNSEHTFIFLTKQPQNLPEKFPANCWVGVSVTNSEMLGDALDGLDDIRCSVRFISAEPLLASLIPKGLSKDEFSGYLAGTLNWVITGQATPVKQTTMPRVEWIREIVEAADKAGIKVFLKDNLYDLLMSIPHADLFWEDMSNLRQEFPDDAKGK